MSITFKVFSGIKVFEGTFHKYIYSNEENCCQKSQQINGAGDRKGLKNIIEARKNSA